MLTWRAFYRDEKYLPQYNEDGTENRYTDIDRYRLVRFDLVNEENKTIYSLYLQQGQRLIFRRRNFIKMNGERWLVYLVGWQKTFNDGVRDHNITAINYIHPDGSISLDNARDNLELLPEESEG